MDLHIVLITLIVFVLVVLVAHGIWSSRREKTQIFKSANTFTEDSRIQGKDISAVNSSSHGISNSMDIAGEQEYSSSVRPRVEHTVESIKITLPNQQVPQPPKPVSTLSRSDLLNRSIAEVEQTVGIEQGVDISAAELKEQLAQRTAQLPRVADTVVNQTQIKSTLNETTGSQHIAQGVNDQPNTQSAVERKDRPAAILFYVVSPAHKPFYGPDIVRTLESLHFCYEEDGLFHRYFEPQDNRTPVLFSAANMYKPGVFDLDSINDFTSAGLVIFMRLPSHGNDLANFRLLQRNVQSLAQALGGEVLDSERKPFTQASKEAYEALL